MERIQMNSGRRLSVSKDIISMLWRIERNLKKVDLYLQGNDIQGQNNANFFNKYLEAYLTVVNNLCHDRAFI
jgi:hypothetical protein